jgi:ribose-phosphate pyrophosphokinase
MTLDLTKGFGDYENYNLFKFPDESIKFILKTDELIETVVTRFKNNDDLISLLFVSDVIQRTQKEKPTLYISYMMYQQDDRLFDKKESYGLKIISGLINTLFFSNIVIFHPHSDKVEFINNVEIKNNFYFIEETLAIIIKDLGVVPTWVIPDSGAYKTQIKQIEKLCVLDYIVCSKSRDGLTGELTQSINTEDLQGSPCIIFDDICLGGRTFIGIAKELKKKNAGKLYLAVSHGIFNQGIEHLLEYFDYIFTTDSHCDMKNEKLIILRNI